MELNRLFERVLRESRADEKLLKEVFRDYKAALERVGKTEANELMIQKYGNLYEELMDWFDEYTRDLDNFENCFFDALKNEKTIDEFISDIKDDFEY
jgi:phage-related tail protein